MSEPAGPLLLVRLRARQPNGAMIGEREQTCHLVPCPESETVAEALTAYCGLQIASGAADLLNSIEGMPCEACLAHSPIPVFAMLRPFRGQLTGEIGSRVIDV